MGSGSIDDVYLAVDAALREAGVVALRLDVVVGPEFASGVPNEHVELLVRRGDAGAARAALDGLDWTYRLGGMRSWRRIPLVIYTWHQGPQVTLNWRMPCAPTPAFLLRRFRRILWNGSASDRPGVNDIAPAARALHVAVQHARGTPWRRSAAERPDADRLASCRDFAQQCGLDRTITLLRQGTQPSYLRFDGLVADWLSHVCTYAARRMRPARFRPRLFRQPQVGEAPLLARLAGVETLTPAQVFAPAPDAGRLAELAIAALPTDRDSVAVDCGAGSGAIAFAIASARPRTAVHALELDAAAVRAARRNRRRLAARNVSVAGGSLLEPLPDALRGRVDVLVANLPFYSSTNYAPIGTLDRSTIVGDDDDGLGLYRALLRQAKPILAPGATVILQMFAWQWPLLGDDLASNDLVAAGTEDTGPFVLARAQHAPR